MRTAQWEQTFSVVYFDSDTVLADFKQRINHIYMWSGHAVLAPQKYSVDKYFGTFVLSITTPTDDFPMKPDFNIFFIPRYSLVAIGFGQNIGYGILS